MISGSDHGMAQSGHRGIHRDVSSLGNNAKDVPGSQVRRLRSSLEISAVTSSPTRTAALAIAIE